MKDMSKKERAEMWRQLEAYVEQLERAVETQRTQLKRRQERINELKARARAERTCQMDMVGRSECICSECGALTHWVHVDKPNYCHNCGAKAVGDGGQ